MRKVKTVMDQEWVELILTARKMGLTKEEIRNYLEREGKKEK